MILLAGIPSETPLALVAQELSKLSIPFVIFNQRDFENTSINFEISDGRISGQISFSGSTYDLQNIRGVYVRLMDDQFLPELANEPQNSPKRLQCRSLHEALIRWCEITPARVVNRTAAMSSNSSKPYQSQIIRQYGFLVPETLITNDQKLVIEFRQKYGKIVYKSISGVRSIVHTLEDSDLERLRLISWCPVQFQQYVEGENIRVHVINSRVFATAVNTSSTDYRYAHTEGAEAKLRAVEIPQEIQERCISLSNALGLAFSGIDFKLTPDNEFYCFEVNPSPAYSYYEGNTGQPISKAVACYLAGID